MDTWIKILSFGAIVGVAIYQVIRRYGVNAHTVGDGSNSSQPHRRCVECNHETFSSQQCGHAVCAPCFQRYGSCPRCRANARRRVSAKDSFSTRNGSRAPADNQTENPVPDDITCAICYEKKINRVFGCGHTCCSDCIVKLSTCHQCRAKIGDVRRIYLNTDK